MENSRKNKVDFAGDWFILDWVFGTLFMIYGEIQRVWNLR